MKLPCISIVTPSFNSIKYLEQTIRSVVNQNYPNLEYIIIDGGSEDGSVEIIKKYEKSIYYWCSEPDCGMYDALRKGFSKGKGQIMGWINSDDLLFPWTLKTLAEIFTKFPEMEWVSSLYPCLINLNGALINSSVKIGYARRYFMKGLYMSSPGRRRLHFIQQESTFWKRSLYDRVGGINSDYQYAGDFDLWARFFEQNELYGLGSMLGAFRYCSKNQLSVKYFGRYYDEALDSLHKAGGAPCCPFREWLLLKKIDIMEKFPRFKCPSLGLLEYVQNVFWNADENEWEVIDNWI